jgi:hypothetical protein
MRELLLILLCVPLLTLSQQTYVPDDVFEDYLELQGFSLATPTFFPTFSNEILLS